MSGILLGLGQLLIAFYSQQFLLFYRFLHTVRKNAPRPAAL